MTIDTDVLVVGAGPIGLVNAWGMKRLNPKLKIVILEKYEEYKRSHVLNMQWAELKAIMQATHSEDEPELQKLLKQLQNDPHIRTNTLQKIFSDLAKKEGVAIITEHEVKDDTIQQTLEQDYPKAHLIIGADGTHSVVSRTLFSKDNIVKHDFDYVLQLRFDIDGRKKAAAVPSTQFFQQMGRKGIIANEYVGHHENGKTPVTMQMMITKKDFLLLKEATSKNPLKPFVPTDHTLKLPPHLQSFIGAYLKNRINADTKQKINSETVTISVNETPATHAKQLVTTKNNARVILKGDAALGLSYFKGLNASLAASARFLSTMEASIKDSFADKAQMDKQLHEYENWFLNDFAPKKVKEVGKYSFWQIRTVMFGARIIKGIKNASHFEDDEILDPAIEDYFRYYNKDPLIQNVDKRWKAYPHRDYDPVKLGQFEYVPLKHTAIKIAKIFTDFFKPYKSSAQLRQDYKQPLVGLNNFFMGLVKIIVGLFTLDYKRFADGFFSLIRGCIELITIPLTWFLKPITRGIATLVHGGFKTIEEGQGMHNLAQYGLDYLEKPDIDLSSSRVAYELLAVCNDLHRKFDKSLARGQKTTLETAEYESYAEIRSDTQLDCKKLGQYFLLFAPKKEKTGSALEDEVIQSTPQL